MNLTYERLRADMQAIHAATAAPYCCGPVQIIESVDLVLDGPPREVPRAWRDRLFSRPWRPWVATETIVPKIPHPGALRLSSGALVMHPETARRLRHRCINRWQDRRR